MSRLLLTMLLGALLQPAFAGELFPFAMPWDDASPNLTNLASWNAKPAGAQGFVQARDGHLYVGAERIRFLGANIVFGSAMPSHADADKIAARMARFGINIVRLHHMDSRPTPDGLLQKDMKTLDPEQMDRLDYFIAALKREGIYSNINLHVGRNYPGFANWGEDTPRYWKGVDNFFPPMLVQQKEYAKALLTHLNPYTQHRYVDEPAIAFIEINNENGLIHEWRNGQLDGMTDPYRAELNRQWQTWLKARYTNTTALRAAWGVQEMPLGPEILGSAINVKSNASGWNVQLVGSAQARLTQQDDVLTLSMTQGSTEKWHTQLHQNGLSIAANQPYSLTFRSKADRPMKIHVALMQAHAPWQSLWSQDITVGKDWQTYQATFAPPQGETQARLTLSGLGQYTGQLYLSGSSFKTGGILGLRPEQNLEAGTIAALNKSDYLNSTIVGQRDWLQFLWDTETAYWTGMQHFIKTELHAQSPIIGTQAHYSPAPIQGLLDVVDSHAYWQHPRFPGKPWDQSNWLIGNSPMAGLESGGTLPDLALRRVAGKPFVVTEYNHPAPSHFQGEAMPLVAAYGAMQNWDGIFVYSYGAHDRDWNPGYIRNFFDSHANPVKMASLIASAALLRRGDVSSPGLAASPMPANTEWIETLRTSRLLPSAEYRGTARSEALIRPVSIASPAAAPSALPYRSTTGELVWGAQAGQVVTINTPRSKALIGGQVGKVNLSGVELELLDARNHWATLLATALTGRDFASSGQILLTTLGQVENTGQQWDAQKTTLGKRLGKAPTLIEGIGARISLPVAASRVKAWALDERGNRREALQVSGQNRATIEVGEHQHTLWYEIMIQ